MLSDLSPSPARFLSGNDGQHAWYVLRTKQYKERATQQRLESDGVTTYLPLLMQRPRPVVGSDVAPIFPCYLFVHADLRHDFHRVASTPGVLCYVGGGAGPTPVDDAVITFLRSRESPDGLIHYDALPAGCNVRIVSGPFRGLSAVVERPVPARERVRILLDILQRRTPVELPERWLRQA